MNTSYARKADYVYVYGLCALSNLCVQISLLRVKRICCMFTACALEAAYSYEYVFARKVAFTSMSWWLVQRSDDRRDGCYLIRPTYR